MYLASLGVKMDKIEKFKKKIEREMKSGFISLLLLYVIKNDEDQIYGYRLIQKIKEATDGRLNFREGTVYPILRYLQGQDFLTYSLGESPKGAPRKYYVITEEGKTALGEGLRSWQELRDHLTGIFQNLEVK